MAKPPTIPLQHKLTNALKNAKDAGKYRTNPTKGRSEIAFHQGKKHKRKVTLPKLKCLEEPSGEG